MLNSSTQNILDVAEAHIGASRLMLSAAAEKVAGQEGLAAQPQATPHDCGTNLAAIRPSRSAEFLDVADQASGNAPLTDGFQVGDEGVTESSPVNLLARGRGAVPSDSQFQGTTIEALMDAVFRAEEHAAEIERVQK